LFSTTDVFVVGGGPAGLAVAIAARQKGFRVTVADSAQPPIDKACGEGLMPEGVAALNRLGVIIEPAQSFSFRGIRFIDRSTSVQADFPSGPALGVRRTTLHALMVEQATRAGVSMLWGTRVRAISPEGVHLHDRTVRCRWIVGADGSRSAVRHWAGLDSRTREAQRFGFRRHYRVTPWSSYMELYWGDGCQVYVTPVGPGEICVVLLSSDSHLRLDEALLRFPELMDRLRGEEPVTTERGAVSGTRRLSTVTRGKVALAGDASGSVDAITGEGLCLAFQHALALAKALAREDLAAYDVEHRRIGRRPELMATLLLAMDHRNTVRHRALRALAAKPDLFADILAMHVGATSPIAFVLSAAALGWQMLIV
jgi:menaquinone-9 beta-reductase